MKRILHAIIAALLFLTLNCLSSSAFAQGTAFTYQGLLQNSGGPASGTYNLTFTLFATNITGIPISGPVTNPAVAVSNGLFVTTVDFGPGVFTAESNWLEIAVETNGGAGFTTLAPRQRLTPTPYAVTAENLGGIISDSQLPGFQPPYSTIGGGYENTNTGSTATIGGGGQNVASGSYSMIGGGEGNDAADQSSTIAGGDHNMILSLSGLGSAIGGGDANSINYTITSIAPFTYTSSSDSTIGGGFENAIYGNYATISGGYLNAAGADFTTVAGGDGNSAGQQDATVGGGVGNNASGGDATIAGGYGNVGSGTDSAIGGGRENHAVGEDSTVPGGLFDYANGALSFAAGYNANANYAGSFVWADDSTSLTFSDTGVNQFRIRAKGGVQIISGGLAVTGASSPNYQGTSGVYLENSGSAADIYGFNYNNNTALPLMLNSPGGDVGVGGTTPTHLFQVGSAYCDGTGWYPSSDRNIKTGFEAVSAGIVLDKVAALPITRWHYTNDLSAAHIGPMAQDFYAAFDIGPDDKHIGPIDEGGVALAAIQGLNQKLESDNAKLIQENDLLARRLDELETEVKTLAHDNH